MTQRDHNRKQRLDKHVLDVVHEEHLHGARAVWEDGACGVGSFKVFHDLVGVG